MSRSKAEASRRRPLVLLAALPLEARLIASRFRRLRLSLSRRGRGGEGRIGTLPVRFHWTGLGTECAERFAQSLIDSGEVGWIVSLGSAGATDPALEPGAVVIADETCLAPREASGESTAFAGDRYLLRAAAAACSDLGITPRIGRMLTVARPVLRPEDRRRWYEQAKAVVVEMESAAVARAASYASIPFLAVRAVSDTYSDSILSEDVLFDEAGELLRSRLAGKLLRNPGRAAGLLRFARQLRVAMQRLGSVVEALATRLEEEQEA